MQLMADFLPLYRESLQRLSTKSSTQLSQNMQHWYKTVLLVCVCASLQRGTGSESDLLVQLESGTVRGLTLKSAKNNDFYAFRGVPYGRSTAGPGRFKAPQPVDPWEGVFDATRYGPECPQFCIFTRGVVGTEDCLALNIYTPQLPASSLMANDSIPVLVFIHGGGFTMGSGSYIHYGAERLMDYSVVLVTINYRLGALGFLSTGDSASPGNYGMMDQVLALRWVKDNIASFGGDPDRVTIFGESAGAASVIYHLLSPLSKGLFQRAIAQSGSALNHWALQKEPFRWANELARLVDCPTVHMDTHELVKCLKNKSVYELIRRSFDLQITSVFPIFFAPVLEPSYIKSGFLTEDPYYLLKSGKIANRVPLILGINELEFYTFYNDLMGRYQYKGRQHLDEEFHMILPFLFHMTSNDKNVYEQMYEEYFGDLNLRNDDDIEKIHMRMLSDASFGVGVAQTAELYSSANIPTWTYIYSHVGQHSLSVCVGIPPGEHASHGDELFVQFPFFYAKNTALNAADGNMSHILNSLWTSFAKGKNLTITSNDKLVAWHRFNLVKPNFLRLNLKPEMETNKLVDKYEFWTEIMPLISKKHTMEGEFENYF